MKKELQAIADKMGAGGGKLTSAALGKRGPLSAAGGGVAQTKEQMEKETLDVELELMSKKQQGANVTGLQRRLTDLKQQLLRLEVGTTAACERERERTRLLFYQ